LRKRYEARISGPDAARSKLELHCEGEGFQHPRLYVPSGDELTQEGLPYILLAKALGIVLDRKSPATGKSELVFLTKGANGYDNPPVKLGLNLIESVDKIDAENLEVIRSAVQKVLNQDYLHIEKQNDLKKQILMAVNEVKSILNEDFDDPVYKRFNEAGIKADKIVGREE